MAAGYLADRRVSRELRLFGGLLCCPWNQNTLVLKKHRPWNIHGKSWSIPMNFCENPLVESCPFCCKKIAHAFKRFQESKRILNPHVRPLRTCHARLLEQLPESQPCVLQQTLVDWERRGTPKSYDLPPSTEELRLHTRWNLGLLTFVQK